jgi:hypothetical protein
MSMADADSGGPEKKRPESPPIEFLKPGETQAPPPEPQQPAAWVTRPEDYQRPQYSTAPAPPRPAATGSARRAHLAGILLILAGIVGVGETILASLTPLSAADYANLSSNATSYALSQICAIVTVWAQAAALLGGIMAFQRMNWKLTFVCAVFAMLTGGYFLFEASFLGMIGFILVIVGRKEFLS